MGAWSRCPISGIRAMLGYCCVAAMVPFSSAMKFDIEKFDRRMIFGLWQVQVKDVLIQSGLHKMRRIGYTRRYCPGGASSAESSESAPLWLRNMMISSEILRDILLVGPHCHGRG
ncbi:hypothetical protein PIB30_052484 [Stylosanthes scabra]|uniref:Secreted protein n=1 Tax=Stylosanthes scabra TaxID=79078 RepID=A0ABU6SI56_9FABA|nr:hypothetical protein [Stylosanthes scabra]